MLCERAAQIEVEGHQPYRKHKHDSGKDDHVNRPFLWSMAGYPARFQKQTILACSRSEKL